MGVAERRERERCERRQQILEAAERVFLERGAADATMGDVASEAELSKGTLYLYFSSKDELYLALATRTLEMMGAQVDEAIARGEASTGIETIALMMRSHREFTRAQPERVRTLIAWMAAGFHADAQGAAFADYQRMTGEIRQRALRHIRRGQLDGTIRPEINPLHTMMQMWGGTMGMSMLFLNQQEVARRLPQAPDFDAVYDGYGEMLLRSIRAERVPGTGANS